MQFAQDFGQAFISNLQSKGQSQRPWPSWWLSPSTPDGFTVRLLTRFVVTPFAVFTGRHLHVMEAHQPAGVSCAPGVSWAFWRHTLTMWVTVRAWMNRLSRSSARMTVRCSMPVSGSCHLTKCRNGGSCRRQPMYLACSCFQVSGDSPLSCGVGLAWLLL